jgi:hypothetical protein
MFHEKNTKLGHAIQSIFHENNFVLFIDESLLLRKEFKSSKHHRIGEKKQRS